jgi:hypothetical protein
MSRLRARRSSDLADVEQRAARGSACPHAEAVRRHFSTSPTPSSVRAGCARRSAANTFVVDVGRARRESGQLTCSSSGYTSTSCTHAPACRGLVAAPPGAFKRRGSRRLIGRFHEGNVRGVNPSNRADGIRARARESAALVLGAPCGARDRDRTSAGATNVTASSRTIGAAVPRRACLACSASAVYSRCEVMIAEPEAVTTPAIGARSTREPWK